MKAIRWSDNDRRWGPFTYANENRADGRGREERRQFGVVLTSGRTDEDEGECAIRLHLRGRTLIIALPQIVKPAANWVSTAHYAWSKGPNSGYWDVHSRDIGFLFVMGALHIYCGRVTGDSDTDRSVVWFLPWKGWRHVRFSLYGLDGTHIWSQFDKDRPVGREIGSDGVAVAWRAGGFHDQRYEAEKACPTATFSFLDFDQETLTAATQIQEREWHRGEGRFKWLSWFTKPKIRKSLDIRFSGETGKRKGSWKGGTVGHSIDMLPGELHEAAFRRYCAAHGMTFVGVPANNG